MGKYKPTLEEVYNSYVQEVIERNQTAMEQDKVISEEYKDMSISELKAIIKELCIKEDKYKNRKGKKTGQSRYGYFLIEEKARAAIECYTPEVQVIIQKRNKDIDATKSRADITDEDKSYIINTIRHMFVLKLEMIFDSLPINQQEEVLKDYYIKYISQIKGDSDVRDNVRKEFGDNIKFKGEKDKGNCTKAITVSLYNLQKKFGHKKLKHFLIVKIMK